jgi:hypothetical protein
MAGAAVFLFLFLKARAGGAASLGGAGSGVQDFPHFPVD